MKNNCYTCRFREPVVGSAHSACNACEQSDVLTKKIPKFLYYLGFATGQAKAPFEFSQHGFNNGWFNYPVNFDPTWIKSECLFFEPKNIEKNESNKKI
jgi:hypothetical protein